MGRRRRGLGPHGLVVAHKPVGPTSFAVMRAVQRMVGAERAGHAGTLDPAASGVLLVLLGEATKLAAWMVDHDKVYVADVALGVQTTTDDAQGEVLAQAELPPDALDLGHLRQVLAGFVGQVDQVPPIYSALKRGGRSLMSLARAGEEVHVEPRPVVCHGVSVRSVDPARARIQLEVHTGPGYYIRSLARDLGLALGTRAHLAGLVRTRVGAFSLDEAVSPEAVTPAQVLPIPDAARGLLSMRLEPAAAEDVFHGRPVTLDVEADRVVALRPDGRPLALLRRGVDGQFAVDRGFRVAEEPAQVSDRLPS